MSAASTYFSSFLTHTTAKYNTLKQTLTSSETDGDTEDDSHISRVLRAYYTEKGRPFPEWLPPDPKAPPAPRPTPQAYNTTYGNPSMHGQQAQYQQNQQYQQQQQQQQPSRWQRTGGGGGLSDLWDSPKNQSHEQPHMPSSLRPGRPSAPQQVTSTPAPSRGRFNDLYENSQGSNSRLGLRDDRLQTQSPTPSVTSSGATTKDMLKAKLWGGGRSGSPVQPAYQSQSQSPSQSQSFQHQSNSNPYANHDQGSSGRRNAPTGSTSGYGSNPYADQSGYSSGQRDRRF